MSESPKIEDPILELFEKIKKLETELSFELQKKQEEFLYEVNETRVSFEKEVQRQHRRLKKRVWRFFKDAAILNILTAPFIYSLIIPAVILDAFMSVYQNVCFPVYGIPKVRRKDYIIMDRQYLSYLNWIEKLNCVYCGYFNGLMSYSREIAARTEQYWCPIKHARKLKSVHTRYRKFFDYGDANDYQVRLKKIRKDYKDD